MSRTIWKFPLSISHVTTVNIPRFTSVRLAAIDPDSEGPAIWIELDPAQPRVDRHFVIYGTGHQIEGDGGYPDDMHVGSLIDEPLVWHVFERRELERKD